MLVARCAVVVAILAICLVSPARADCTANDTPQTQVFCDASFKQLCYSNTNGTIHHACLTCESSILEYDCTNCKCVVKSGWIAAFVIIGIVVLASCCLCCCFFCAVCPVYSWRMQRANARRASSVQGPAAAPVGAYSRMPDPQPILEGQVVGDGAYAQPVPVVAAYGQPSAPPAAQPVRVVDARAVRPVV